MSGQTNNITKNVGSLKGLTISNIGSVTTTTTVNETNNVNNNNSELFGDIILKVTDTLYTSLQSDPSGGIISTATISNQEKYRKRITYFSDTALNSGAKQLKEGAYIEFGPNGNIETPITGAQYYDSIGISLYATNTHDNRVSHKALSIYTQYDSDNLKSQGVVDISGILYVTGKADFNNSVIVDVSSIQANQFIDSQGNSILDLAGITGVQGAAGSQGATGSQGCYWGSGS